MATQAPPATRGTFSLLRFRDGRFFEEHFATLEEARAAITDEDIQAALAAAGSWADLDYDEAVEALERFRQESPPSPPLEEV